MSAKDQLPEIVEYFLNCAKLFAAVCADTNADTFTQKTVVTHFATGEKYDVKLLVTKQKGGKHG